MADTVNETHSQERKLPLGLRLLGGAGAGALLAFCFPPFNLPFLAPIGFAALLGFMRDAPPRYGFYTGVCCGISYFGFTLTWLPNIFGYGGAVGLVVLLAMFVGLFGGSYCWLREKLPSIPIWLLAPVLWTATEILRSEHWYLSFGWMGLGYSVVGYPILAKPAAWFGSYFVTFLIAIVGSVLLNYAIASRKMSIRFLLSALIWLALFFVPTWSVNPINPMTVRLVQAESGNIDGMIKLSELERGNIVDAIVWPEYSYLTDPRKDTEMWESIRGVARRNQACLLFGAMERVGGLDYNTAFVVDSTGYVVGTYHKNHPVHLFEDGAPGREAKVIHTSLGKLGVGICFDFDFPDVARKLTQDGAEVFLVPNMDASSWGKLQREQHRQLFQMRALECGRWLARADVAGGTSVASPNGQEVARIGTTGEGKLDVIVGRTTRQTIYTQGGWRFADVCLLAAGLLAVSSLVVGWNRRIRRPGM